MVRVISRKDLNKQDFGKAVIKDNAEASKCSMLGFAEAMYYYYQLENNNTNKGEN